ncbi:hypothetical protein [Chamaesiphon minutus]|uniref:Uncharacterized protein n=1 Tax=Chamaesiphon minutus (strain ATCC 27169 / PCC 6605) TaxID=1173020 RepID=K9UCH6_CHAP6|nr:hypothetical protein [Chamaesiphon minutus]AFY92782.1 hypothetical protein Cha6605_1637 [Chamaesiphon minutus PCC 6605]
MPIRMCAYGFSCASMMMAPGLTAEDCPNKNICGTIRQLTEEDRVELHYARIENNVRTIDTIITNRRDAALYLLSTRACPQTPASLGVTATLARLCSTLSLIEETIAQLSSEDSYIAPIGVEAHRYLVKRPYGIYQYNKLTSREAIFPPQEREAESVRRGSLAMQPTQEESVKVIHLSSDYDSRNFEGRAGIERRNRLLAIDTALNAAEALLNRAIEAAANPPVNEVVAEKIARIPLEDGV